MAKAMKCECNPGMKIWGLVLMAVGLYFLVWGFLAQTGSALSWSAWNWNAALLYLIGFFLLGAGKRAKWKSCMNCSIHGMCKK